MTADTDGEALKSLVELLRQMVQDKDDPRRLLAAFSRGEVTSEEIVAQLATQYQAGIGGAVWGLAAKDKDAARQLGERLRERLDCFLAELGGGDGPAAKGAPRTSQTDSFKDRDDAVLLREYVIMKILTRGDEPVRSASIFEAVHSFEKNVSDETITAQLVRLQKAEIVGRQRKGRYHGIARSHAHLTALKAEIDARGLKLPAI